MNPQEAAGRLLELAEQSRRSGREERELGELQEQFGDDDAPRTARKARMKGAGMPTPKQIREAEQNAERENRERGERIQDGSRAGESSYGQQQGEEYFGPVPID